MHPSSDRRPQHFRLSPIVIAMLSMVASSYGRAQDADPAPTTDAIAVDAPAQPEEESAAPAPGSSNRFMQEIVVTAQKREENVQDVPISVTALSGELLDAKGVTDPTKLAEVTPSLTYNSITGFAIIYIRGVGSDAFLTADPSVASYIDGIYYPFSSGLAQSFGRVERIEVLKGPQGTLFGRNSTGGAISITTETPSTSLEGTVQTSYSRFNKSDTNVLVSGPLGEHFAASVAALYSRSDNYYQTNQDSPIQDLPTETAKGLRAKVRWLPTDDLDVILGYTRIKQDGMGTALAPNTRPSSITALLGGRAPEGTYGASFDAPTVFNIDNEVYTGQLRWKLGGLDLKMLGSFQKIANLGRTDFDGTSAPIVSFSADPLYSKVQSGELQLLSNKDSWGSDWLEWIGGYYYFHSRAGLLPRLSLLGGYNDVIGIGSLPQIPLGALVDSLPQGIQALLGPAPFTHGVIVRLTGEAETQSHAVFAQTTAHVTDWAAITLGARYQKERREATDSTFGTENEDGSVTTLFDFVKASPFPQPPLVKHTSFFSPKISISLTPIDDVMFYASWQKANKSGTYNIINLTDGIEYAKPEEIRAYEIGVKSEFLNGNVRLNAALFHSKIKDLQVQFVSLLNGGAVSVENAGGARSRGAEIDTTILPFPELDSGFVINAGGAYVDAIYTDYTDGSGFNDNPNSPFYGVYQPGQDFSGRRMARTPKYSGNLSLSQTFATDTGPIEVAVDTAYNSGYGYLAQGTMFRQGEYQTYSARASFLWEQYDLRLTIFGDNLSNEVYDLGQFPQDFGRLEARQPPRSFGVRLAWNF